MQEGAAASESLPQLTSVDTEPIVPDKQPAINKGTNAPVDLSLPDKIDPSSPVISEKDKSPQVSFVCVIPQFVC